MRHWCLALLSDHQLMLHYTELLINGDNHIDDDNKYLTHAAAASYKHLIVDSFIQEEFKCFYQIFLMKAAAGITEY